MFQLANESSRVAMTLPLYYCLVHAGGEVGGFPIKAYQSSFVVEVLSKEGLPEHVNKRKLQCAGFVGLKFKTCPRPIAWVGTHPAQEGF